MAQWWNGWISPRHSASASYPSDSVATVLAYISIAAGRWPGRCCQLPVIAAGLGYTVTIRPFTTEVQMNITYRQYRFGDDGFLDQIVSCYQSVFADPPWSEWRRCNVCGEQWGRAEWDAWLDTGNEPIHCGQLVHEYWPADQVKQDIAHELSPCAAVGWRSMRSKCFDSAGDTQLHLKTWSGSWRLRSCSGFCGGVATRRYRGGLSG